MAVSLGSKGQPPKMISKKYVTWIKDEFNSSKELYHFIMRRRFGKVISLNHAYHIKQAKPFIILGKVVSLTPRLSDIRKQICKQSKPATTFLVKEFLCSKNKDGLVKVFKVKCIGDIANEIESAGIHLGDYVVLVNPIINVNSDYKQPRELNKLVAILNGNSDLPTSSLLCAKIKFSMQNKLASRLRCSTPVSDSKSEGDSEPESIENRNRTPNTEKVIPRLAVKRTVFKEFSEHNSPRKMMFRNMIAKADKKEQIHHHMALNDDFNSVEYLNEKHSQRSNNYKKTSNVYKSNFIKIKEINEKYLNRKIDMFVIVLDVLQPQTAGKNKQLTVKVIDDSCLKLKPFMLYMFYEDKSPKVEQGLILRLRHVKIESCDGVYDGRTFTAGSVVSFASHASLDIEHPVTLRKAPYECNEFDMSYVSNLRRFAEGKNWNVLRGMEGFYPSITSEIKVNTLEGITDESWISLQCEVIRVRTFFDHCVIVLTVSDGTVLQHTTCSIPKDCKLWSNVLNSSERHCYKPSRIDIIIKNLKNPFDMNYQKNQILLINKLQILRHNFNNGKALMFVVDASHKDTKIDVLRSSSDDGNSKTNTKPYLNDYDSSDVDEMENSELTRRFKSRAREISKGLSSLPERLGPINADIEVIEEIRNCPPSIQIKPRKKLFFKDNSLFDTLVSSEESTPDFYDLKKQPKEVEKCYVFLEKINDKVESVSSRTEEQVEVATVSNVNRNDEDVGEGSIDGEEVNKESKNENEMVQEINLLEQNTETPKLGKRTTTCDEDKMLSNDIHDSFRTIIAKENVKLPTELRYCNLLPIVRLVSDNFRDQLENEIDYDDDSIDSCSSVCSDNNYRIKGCVSAEYKVDEGDVHHMTGVKRKAEKMKDSISGSEFYGFRSLKKKNYAISSSENTDEDVNSDVTLDTEMDFTCLTNTKMNRIQETYKRTVPLEFNPDLLNESSVTSIESDGDSNDFFISNGNKKRILDFRNKVKCFNINSKITSESVNKSSPKPNYVCELQSKTISSQVDDENDENENGSMNNNNVLPNFTENESSILKTNVVVPLAKPIRSSECSSHDVVPVKRPRGRPRRIHNTQEIKKVPADSQTEMKPESLIPQRKSFSPVVQCHSPVYIADSGNYNNSDMDLVVDEDSDSIRSECSDKVSSNLPYLDQSKHLASARIEGNRITMNNKMLLDTCDMKQCSMLNNIELQSEMPQVMKVFSSANINVSSSTIRSSLKNKILSRKNMNSVEKANNIKELNSNSPPSPTASITTVMFPFRNERSVCNRYKIKQKLNYIPSNRVKEKSINRVVS